MQRKEARITEYPADALTALARRLNRLRQGSGERITDKTLLRVAIELLRTRENEITGTTENKILTSLGL